MPYFAFVYRFRLLSESHLYNIDYLRGVIVICIVQMK